MRFSIWCHTVFSGVSIILMIGLFAIGDQVVLAQNESAKPNVLIVTVDDMSADSIGAYGCTLDDTTPSIDEFAKSSLQFRRAHVQVGNCMPGRNLMWSGLFSHVNGVEGFQQNKNPHYPVLCDLAKQAGYFAAIRGKVSHSTPYHPYAWDADVTRKPDGGQYHVKDPLSYGASTRDAIRLAKEAGKPFCLMVNISDPHKPFFNQSKAGKPVKDQYVPSRVFSADEVPVPGFLPDDPAIRGELASYYSTVRRADDCFSHVMSALEESGALDNTFVMFLSDHGMPLPFAKTQLYHHSTNTPLMIRWPGVTKENRVDNHHMVSAIDLLPTLLEVMGHQHPAPSQLHGRSFVPLLMGQSQLDRDHVILQYNENSGRNRHPMRAIHSREFLYIFNPWSDGKRKFATATTGTATYRRMVVRAKDEPEIAARLELFDHRVLEELYDVSSDPDCLNNLIGSPDHQLDLEMLRQALLSELIQLEDPVAPILENISDEELRAEFMKIEDAKKTRGRAQQKKKQADKDTPDSTKKRYEKAIQFAATPSRLTVSAGQKVGVIVEFQLPDPGVKHQLHVTMKLVPRDRGKPSIRFDRKIVEIQDAGVRTISLSVPKDVERGITKKAKLVFAAFIGEDYESRMVHIVSKPCELTLVPEEQGNP